MATTPGQISVLPITVAAWPAIVCGNATKTPPIVGMSQAARRLI